MLDKLRITLDALVVKITRSMEMSIRNNFLQGQYNKSSVEKLAETLLNFAEVMGASDIHIEPQDICMRVRFRIDGKLLIVYKFSQEIGGYLTSYLKLAAGLDIAEKRIPQDGSILINDKIKEQNLDVRVSTIPILFGEKVVLRLLGNKNEIIPLGNMNFSVDNLILFKKLIKSSSGIIAITGPVNSGKSTLLYSILKYLNKEELNIVTIEDPIELKIDGINQIQVNLKAGMDFATGLRAVLRQDPDIVMLGEIRDTITAKEAVRAALTGHLVLTTLHTTNALGVPARLIDMGVNPSMLSIAMLASTAQRLVRTICPKCKELYIPNSNSLESLLLGDKFYSGIKLYRGSGCKFCNYSGYSGRIAIQEIMTIDDNIKSLIAKKDVDIKLKRLVQLNGMKNMLDDGIEKILQGKTTAQEVWCTLNGVYKFK